MRGPSRSRAGARSPATAGAPADAPGRKADPDDDLRLFGPDSVTWKVHAEPVLLVAGLRSLHLQALQRAARLATAG